METKNKRHHQQVLNPIIGFGWFTSTKLIKKDLECENSSYKMIDTLIAKNQ